MNERKILNLEKPILRTWSSESHLMSMILMQENSMEWILNNYINLLGYSIIQKNQNLLAFFPKHDPTGTESTLNAWTGCPFLDVHFVSCSYIKNKYIHILEYIMYAIENGYYIYLNLNQENLKIETKVKVHKTFVYGFDKNYRKIYVADHYNVGKYSFAEIGFDEFLGAYNAAYYDEKNSSRDNLKANKDNIYENQYVVIAKPKPFKYDFNLEWFKIQLKDYLRSTYSLNCVASLSIADSNEMYFGISSYDLLTNYLENMLENGGVVKKDWRIFSLLCDHKTLLKMRIDFFRKKGICDFDKKEIERYDILNNNSKIMLNLFLKNIVMGEKEYLKRIKKIAVDMKKMEFDLLQQLFEKINKN